MIERTDVIGQVLRSLRLDGTVYFEARVSAPWGFSIPESDHAMFHYVTSGSLWLATETGGWSPMHAGEAVVLPHGSAHSLGHEPGRTGIDGSRLFSRIDSDGVVRLQGSPGAAMATLVCGHFSYDRASDHPLVRSLPPVLRSSVSNRSAWAAVAELAVAHSHDGSGAAQALTDRLAEVLLIEMLADVDRDDAPFLDALDDVAVAAALQVIHAAPDRPWTVASLSAEVHVSRANLAARFTALVGESPIRYLTRWRMQLAAQQLRETAMSTGEIADRVGYATPFSFSKAFSREYGRSPTAYRDAASC